MTKDSKYLLQNPNLIRTQLIFTIIYTLIVNMLNLILLLVNISSIAITENLRMMMMKNQKDIRVFVLKLS